MTAILETPELRQRVARWSVEDYERLVESGLAPKRGELIRGIIIEKMPKSPLHCTIAKRLYDWLMILRLAGRVIFQERGLRLMDSEPEPDLSIVRGAKEEFYTKHSSRADLVVEVAVSSVNVDREYAALYAEAGVTEYWIILAEARKVEVRRQPLNGIYQKIKTYTQDETLVCESVPGVELPLNRLFL